MIKLFDFKFLILLGLTLVVYFMYKEIDYQRERIQQCENQIRALLETNPKEFHNECKLELEDKKFITKKFITKSDSKKLESVNKITDTKKITNTKKTYPPLEYPKKCNEETSSDINSTIQQKNLILNLPINMIQVKSETIYDSNKIIEISENNLIETENKHIEVYSNENTTDSLKNMIQKDNSDFSEKDNSDFSEKDNNDLSETNNSDFSEKDNSDFSEKDNNDLSETNNSDFSEKDNNDLSETNKDSDFNEVSDFDKVSNEVSEAKKASEIDEAIETSESRQEKSNNFEYSLDSNDVKDKNIDTINSIIDSNNEDSLKNDLTTSNSDLEYNIDISEDSKELAKRENSDSNFSEKSNKKISKSSESSESSKEELDEILKDLKIEISNDMIKEGTTLNESICSNEEVSIKKPKSELSTLLRLKLTELQNLALQENITLEKKVNGISKKKTKQELAEEIFEKKISN
jgi:hypothetical protein